MEIVKQKGFSTTGVNSFAGSNCCHFSDMMAYAGSNLGYFPGIVPYTCVTFLL